MADTKDIDFTSFLNRFPDKGAQEKKPSSTTSGDAPKAAPRLADRILQQLLNGPKSVRDFLPLAGNSVGLVLDTLHALKEIDYVSSRDGDSFFLTEKGKDAADLMR